MQTSDKVRSALKAVPNLGKLLVRLARDPRVPRRNKILFAGIAAYLVLPWDFVPDWMPGIGQIDDLLLVALALDALLNRVPPSVLEDHWDGDEEVLHTIRSVLSTVTTFIPDRVKDKLLSNSDMIER